MVLLLNSFSYGFLFGLGFFSSFILVCFFLVMTLGSLSKKIKESKLRKKLTLRMLEEYRDSLSQEEHYPEAILIREFIKKFKLKQPMDEFFKLYKIETRIRYIDPDEEPTADQEHVDENDNEEEKEILGLKIQKKYFIKKR